MFSIQWLHQYRSSIYNGFINVDFPSTLFVSMSVFNLQWFHQCQFSIYNGYINVDFQCTMVASMKIEHESLVVFMMKKCYRKHPHDIINQWLFIVPQVEEGKQTPFQSALVTNDVTYSLRHVEESWIHLLKAGGHLQLLMLVYGFIFILFYHF